MKRVICCLMLALASVAEAQLPPATAKSKLSFTIDGLSGADAQNLVVYKLYIDDSLTGVVLPVTCVSSGGVSVAAAACSASMPAFTPGAHTIVLTASNEAGESERSDPVTFRMVIVPGKPKDVRIQQQ